jgi:hypothetical protein
MNTGYNYDVRLFNLKKNSLAEIIQSKEKTGKTARTKI